MAYSRPLVWELIRGGYEVIATLEQSAEDFETNGRGYMLDAIIPDEHADAAQRGEWDEFGFTYTADDGGYYLVQYYRKLDVGGD